MSIRPTDKAAILRAIREWGAHNSQVEHVAARYLRDQPGRASVTVTSAETAAIIREVMMENGL